jgi:undecaprenyl-diphosphatase
MAIVFKRETIVRFSFLLAIPTMISATGFDLVQSSPQFSQDEVGFLAAGFAASFVVAILAIKYFLRFVQSNNLVPFGIYRVAIGIAFLLFF